MPEPVKFADVGPNEIEERLCRYCAAAYYGFYGPNGLCHKCRSSHIAKSPWLQSGASKEKA